MELSTLIARIAAVVYMAASLGAFCNRSYYRRISEDIYDNAALTYLTGFVTVILGFLIVHHHNRWDGDWTVLITIIGWLALAKGFAIIAFPLSMRRLSERFLTGTLEGAFPYITLAIGLLFGYFGFFCGGF